MNGGTLIALAACLLGWLCLGIYGWLLLSRARALDSEDDRTPMEAPSVTVRDA